LLKSGLDGHRLVSSVSGYSTLILPESGPLSTRIGSVMLERVDIHLVQMNALARQRIDINARGVCS
jgi:hypothetical protein